MRLEIYVELSTADGMYHFDVVVDNEHHDGGVVDVNSYADAVQWIGNNMLNDIRSIPTKRRCSNVMEVD